MENLLDGIQFESLTTLAVESFFKGMRSDHDMPRVLQYAYRRFQCVKDNMLRIYQKIFSYFTGPNSNTAQRKSLIASLRTLGCGKTKQMAANEGNGAERRGSRDLERDCKGVRKRGETVKCTVKDERANQHCRQTL